jgi:hypothetical protein
LIEKLTYNGTEEPYDVSIHVKIAFTIPLDDIHLQQKQLSGLDDRPGHDLGKGIPRST